MIPLGIIAASGARTGVQSLAYKGTGAGGLTWASAPLGSVVPNRYIVLTAGFRIGSPGTGHRFTGCTLGGVTMEMLHTSGATNASSQTRVIGVFGGYVPTGTTASAVFTTAGSGSPPTNECDYSSYVLIGSGIKKLADQVGSPFAYSMPKNSAIIGVAESDSGGTAIAWTGMTRDTEKDKGSWRYSNASQFYAVATSANVTCDSGQRGFVAIG